jgi:HSP20 family protein
MAEKSAAATKPALDTVQSAIKITEPEGVFERLDRIYNAIARRAFEIFEGNGKTPGREIDDWFKAESELLHPVHINMSEDEKTLTVLAEVPGFAEKELDVRIEPKRLTITGKRETSKKEEKGKTVYQERCSDEIFRVVDLPSEVEKDKATATLKNGVLEIEMPKTEKAASTKVNVRAA